MKKSLKITGIVLASIIILIALIAVGCIIYFYVSTNNLQLDVTKLDGNYTNVQIFDNKNNKVMLHGNNYVDICDVSPYITKTFVSVEDKRFYEHKGIDTKRMVAAAIKNVSSGSLAEGASTITQQLIKNTHLTISKTLKRKLSEIRLALKLEKQLTKSEILEKYLNNLYFGSSIYGVHDACLAFFGKKPSEVNLAEAAILVGVVKNPAKNSPITNYEGAISRQKVIFSVLRKNKTFDENEIKNAENTEIILNNALIYNKMYKSFINNAIFESTQLLDMDEKSIANSGLKIVTYMDSELQNQMYNTMPDTDYDYVRASIDNATGGVTSYVSNLAQVDGQISRQAGSIIKPFSVYLPAYENKLINSMTQILDDKININGYSPSNYNNVYHGYVSVRDSVAHSYNIPAVKLLHELGVNNSIEFLSRYGIAVQGKSQNLTLALGANSVSPLKIASCYSSIARGGRFQNCSFVKQIIDKDGKVLYSKSNNEEEIVSEDVNYQMLDNLLGTSKYGTAKKLAGLPYQIASKTGTVANEQGENTDAWCCAFTTAHTLLAWDGAKSGETLAHSHTGSGLPTMSIKDYADFLYADTSPKDFAVTETIVSLDIDYDKLINEHQVVAVPSNFEGTTIKAIFSTNNLPQQTVFEVDFNVKQALFEDTIEFEGKTGAKYNVYILDGDNKTLVRSLICNGDRVKIIINKPNLFKTYQYSVEYEKS